MATSTLDTIKHLCTPAYIYFVLSFFSFIVLLIQNAGNTNVYCLGSYKCHVPSTLLIFVLKAFYVVFWTFVLNCICKAGYTNISWLLLVLPFLLFFVFLGIMILKQGVINV